MATVLNAHAMAALHAIVFSMDTIFLSEVSFHFRCIAVTYDFLVFDLILTQRLKYISDT